MEDESKATRLLRYLNERVGTYEYRYGKVSRPNMVNYLRGKLSAYREILDFVESLDAEEGAPDE